MKQSELVQQCEPLPGFTAPTIDTVWIAATAPLILVHFERPDGGELSAGDFELVAGSQLSNNARRTGTTIGIKRFEGDKKLAALFCRRFT